jgi:type I restriction enzyme R subunit
VEIAKLKRNLPLTDADLLYEPPFTDLHSLGLDGVFATDDANRIISPVRSFNQTVGKEFGAP